MASRIPLVRRDGSPRAYAMVDEADYVQLSQWRWNLANGYAARQEKQEGGWRLVFMHRQLLGLQPGDRRQADHRNCDKLDNRRANLRILTRAEQQQNRPSYRGSSSRFRGVTWARHAGKWRAVSGLGGRHTHLGYFDTEEAAAEAATSFRREHMPLAHA